MKTTFLLDLTHDGIRLRQRGADGEAVMGEIALDAPDFESRLDALRRDAEARAGGPVETIVTIPASEVLYTRIEGTDAATIGAALDGLTPYALDDLVFDWHPGEAGQSHVAAVARETLAEAESFARAHGFDPRGFAGEPQPGLFDTAPDFGSASGRPAAPDGVGPATPPQTGEQTPLPTATPVLPVGTETGAGHFAEEPAPFVPAPRGPAGPGSGEHAGKKPDRAIPRPSPRAIPAANASRGGRKSASSRTSGLALPAIAALILFGFLAWSFFLAAPPEPEVIATEDAPLPSSDTARSVPVEEPTAPTGTEPVEAPPAEAPPDPERIAPNDPLNRPGGAPDTGRYAATGVEDAVPGRPDIPGDDNPGEVGDGMRDPVLRTDPVTLSLAAPEASPAQPGALLSPPPQERPKSDAEDRGNPEGTVEPPASAEGVAQPDQAPPPRDTAAVPEDESAVAAALDDALPEETREPDAPETETSGPSPDGAPAPAAPAETEIVVTDGPPPVRPPPAPRRDAAAPVPAAIPVIEGAPPVTPPARPQGPATRDETALDPDPAGPAGTDAAPLTLTAPDSPVIVENAPPARPARRPAEMSALPEPSTDSDAVSAAIAAAIATPEPPAEIDPTGAIARSLAPRGRPGDLVISPPATTPDRSSRDLAMTAPALVRGGASLIGVFGSPSNRRALVQLPNGRFEKVSVGDRIDGGQVSEIGSESLTYVRDGMAIPLQLPGG
ncbi:hypothetical protein LX81_02300 [Palleronia aestuarii]|uniref:Type IV pilus biogenesis protein PilP n=1 Tax=Palleronia aestuarii TaxID=568105 RepID=A0A2W7N7I7_9RHOB|nr:hypothetical protein [Palleronia aestuarii]PZX16028.1 hypothetical protein LX81_02300 [Palleronia aestuarii]